jgi:hypothetical protein
VLPPTQCLTRRLRAPYPLGVSWFCTLGDELSGIEVLIHCPSGLPWVGNVIGMNSGAPWVTYVEWARTYVGYDMLSSMSSTQAEIRAGDIVRSRLIGKNMSSPMICECLFPFILLISIHHSRCGMNFSSIFMPYGDRWRLHRRFFRQIFRTEPVQRFMPYQHRRTCHLLRWLFDTPEQLDDHVFE